MNADVQQTNMAERTFVSQRIICDSVAHMLEKKSVSDKKCVQSITVSAKMLQYCRGARSRYTSFLDERRLQGEKAKEETYKDELRKQLECEKKKLESVEKNIGKLDLEVKQLAIKAEAKNKMELLTESNKKRERQEELITESEKIKEKIRRLNEDCQAGTK